ncbi:DUF4962 domain-containing protein [Caldalkalibacillus mannanilyticus]|uniref:DUF4962 domain-containing protein n=1 Tax=Caldalkalibacillus mannanilyticus TaxID=1418 RepID=UPI00046AF6A6|nr:DUF4962 domain-containing protein [Caldalkalibacillus mannanilyticus]
MPDTLKTLYQPVAGELNVQYQPDEQTEILENPPRFTWMPAKLEDDQYILQISASPEFTPEETRTSHPIYYNMYTPDTSLPAGVYFWRYALLNEEDASVRESEWSQVRSFTIAENLPETPLTSRQHRYQDTLLSHPRLWLNEQEVRTFRERLQDDNNTCEWENFYHKSVLPWLNHPLVAEPLPYPNHQRVAPLWRKMYMDCQEVLHAVRHLSVAGVILEDRQLLARAKEWLLHITAWDTEGTTSRDYNDEAAFRVAGALAWGYDWLHQELSAVEKECVRKALFRRTEQVAQHVIERSKIHHVPYDSHAVRSLSSVLVPCCIALLEEEPQVKEWLDYTLEYYATLYTPWGGADGGWAEGPHYWMTGMAYVIDAMNLVKKFTGIDYYQRPFFQKTGDFPLYVYSPDTRRASFGDHANLGERPGLKVGFNSRQYAGVTGNPYYQWYYEQTRKWDIDADDKFYNKGWWDFNFDQLMYLHDYPQVEAQAPREIEEVKWFQDVGWVAMHHRMDDPEEHIMFLTKSSPYGSISHSHGDQNCFVLHAFGEPLAIHSGYYVAFNSTMHMNWRRQTISKNGILIDGKGQYAGKDKVLGIAAKGKIERIETTASHSFVCADATQAYQHEVPYLRRYMRETYFVHHSYFVLIDYVDLDQPAEVDWLFHTLNEMKVKGQTFRVQGEKADLEGRFLYSSAGDLSLIQKNDYPGVDIAEIEGLPHHWRLEAKTPKAKSHRLVTLLVPAKKNNHKYVSYFMDDQDHGISLYFTENGQTFRVEVSKAY